MRFLLIALFGLSWLGPKADADTSIRNKTLIIPGYVRLESALFARSSYREEFLRQLPAYLPMMPDWTVQRVAEHLVSVMTSREENLKRIERSTTLDELLDHDLLTDKIINDLVFAMPGETCPAFLELQYQRLHLALSRHPDPRAGWWIVEQLESLFLDTKVGQGVPIAADIDRYPYLRAVGYLKDEIFRHL